MNELKEALEEFMSSHYAEITNSQYELICNHINNLQSKIDNAIEYIEETIKENYEWDMYRENKLLDILKEDK